MQALKKIQGVNNSACPQEAHMQTSILTRHHEVDDTLRRYVLQRIQTSLSLLIGNIKSVVIKLGTQASNSGEKLKACDIEISVNGTEMVVVSSQTTHWLAAIDQAVEAAARAVRRKLGQVKKKPRFLKLSRAK